MLATNRRNIHYRAVLLLAYQTRGKSPGHQECPGQADLKGLSPRSLGEFEQRLRVHRDRAVYEEINLVECGCAISSALSQSRAPGYIELYELGLRRAQPLGQRLAEVTVHVADDHVSALRDDVLGYLFTDAARSSRNQGVLPTNELIELPPLRPRVPFQTPPTPILVLPAAHRESLLFRAAADDSNRGHAAIDGEVDACDEACLVRRRGRGRPPRSPPGGRAA